MKSAIERIQETIQWLVDNDKLPQKSIDNWNSIIEQLADEQEKDKQRIEELEMGTAQLSFQYIEVQRKFEKLYKMCTAFKICTDISDIADETFDYVFTNKIRLRSYYQLLSINYYIKLENHAKKAIKAAENLEQWKSDLIKTDWKLQLLYTKAQLIYDLHNPEDLNLELLKENPL